MVLGVAVLRDLALALTKRRLIPEQGWKMIPVVRTTDFVVALALDQLT